MINEQFVHQLKNHTCQAPMEKKRHFQCLWIDMKANEMRTSKSSHSFCNAFSIQMRYKDDVLLTSSIAHLGGNYTSPSNTKCLFEEY